MYQSSSMSGWSRALSIIFGLFIIAVGILVIFEPAIVVGLVTVLFAIAFIMLGFWALSMGISGRRVVMTGSQQNPAKGTSDRNVEAEAK